MVVRRFVKPNEVSRVGRQPLDQWDGGSLNPKGKQNEKGSQMEWATGVQMSRLKGKKSKSLSPMGNSNTLNNLRGLPISQWARTALVVLARITSAYWQMVSPVFDSASEIRKRLDRGVRAASLGDLLRCVLAIAFAFLVAAAVI